LGFSDIEAGITNILDWIKTTEWKGPTVDTKKWLVSGHSNGGGYGIDVVILILNNIRPRNMACPYPSSRYNPGRGTSLGLFIYPR